MASFSDNQRLAAVLVLECGAAGVAISPLAGTLVGWSVIVLAVALALYLTWRLINATAGVPPATAQFLPTTLPLPGASKLLIAIPTLLVFIIVVVLSFHGGIPALKSGDPATYVEFMTAVPARQVFQPGETVEIKVIITNRGPFLARDVIWGAVLAIRPALMTPAQEDEMFTELTRNLQSLPPMDFEMGTDIFTTILTPVLNQKEAEDLQSEAARLYLMGIIRYRDLNGPETHEFCRWLQRSPTGRLDQWAVCEGGHNRTVQAGDPSQQSFRDVRQVQEIGERTSAVWTGGRSELVTDMPGEWSGPFERPL